MCNTARPQEQRAVKRQRTDGWAEVPAPEQGNELDWEDAGTQGAAAQPAPTQPAEDQELAWEDA